jgi:hypothetical protein
MSSTISREFSSSSSQRAFSPAHAPLAKDGCELVGVLEGVEPIDDGLLQIRIGGLERCVPEEMELQLRPLVGKRTSLLRIGERYSAAEVQ